MKILAKAQSIVVPKVFTSGHGPVLGKPIPARIKVGNEGYMSGYLKDTYGEWDDPYIEGYEVTNHLTNYSSNVVRLAFAGGQISGVISVRAQMDTDYEVTLSWSDTDNEYRATQAAYADRMHTLVGLWVDFFFELL